MNDRLLAVLLLPWLSLAVVSAEEWQPVPADAARDLRVVAESALTTHWDRCQRGWCRATLKYRGDEQDFSLWWDGDRVGMKVEAVRLGKNREENLAEPKVRHALFTPQEQWEFVPEYNLCYGFSGRSFQRLSSEFDIRPTRIWLSMMGDQVPVFRHRNRLQLESLKAKYLRVSRNSQGHIAFDSPELKLIFDPARGFSPILVESQMKPEEVDDPERLRPIRETYDVAQDRHGEWYCRQMTRQVGLRGSHGTPQIFQSAVINDFDSRPTPEVLQFSFESLALPKGTRVQSTIPRKSGTWIVGRENEGPQATNEERLRRLGEMMKSRGFAAEPPK